MGYINHVLTISPLRVSIWIGTHFFSPLRWLDSDVMLLSRPVRDIPELAKDGRIRSGHMGFSVR